MAYFEELDDILNKIIGEKILANQDICKLLYYYPDSSENNYTYNPLVQPDIPNTSILLMSEIYPVPKLPDTQTIQQGYMTVVLTGGDPMYSNQGFRKVNIVFDIIFHLKSWIVKGGYRPYIICEKIDYMLNNQLTDLPVENKVLYMSYKTKDYSTYYYGIQLVYELQLQSNVGEKLPQNLNIERVKDPDSFPIYKSRILGRNG